VQEPGGVRWPGGAAASLIAALVLVGPGAPLVHAQDGYEIAGEVDGLYPGAETTLNARVTNPHPFAVRVIATSAAVLDASPGCPASMLEIGDSEATVDVPAGGTGTVPLHVRMSRSAPDACQGATWPLAFTGTAVGPDTSGLPGTNLLDARSQGVLALIGATLMAGALLLARRRRPRSGRPAP